MCFSAEASFTASAILAVVGIATLKMAKRKRLILLALLPLFFAFQQFNEGILWLYLPTDPHTQATQFARYVFMFFAYLFWPIYLPLALTVAEPIRWRQLALVLFVFAGIWQTHHFLTNPEEAETTIGIVNHSIQYLPDSGDFRWTYVAIVVIPCFISSLRGIYIFGALVFLAFVGTEYFYSLNFVSVWCFFAAILSAMIYWVIRQERNRLESSTR